MLWETFKLAVQAILRNPMRSFLTVLGVVIGVAAVIAMVTIGAGSSAQVTSDVETLGAKRLMLTPGQERMGPGSTGTTARAFDLGDVDQLAAELSSIETAAPAASSQQVTVYGNENYRTTVTGTDSRYLVASEWEVASGRGFTSAEERGRSVCILGQTVVDELFGTADPIGEDIRIKTLSCEVIGVLEVKGAS
ncbi:MAG: ABC transporter permease, partial [Rhodobacteraceae bacterium]|nr:ABC transporter permease [Paracoccaceae bacterium]